MTEPDLSNIQLHLFIDWGGDPGDPETVEHEVKVCVVGVPHTQIIATVRSDPIKPPYVVRYARRGELELSKSLLDGIVLASFSRLAEQSVLPYTGQQTTEAREDGAWLLEHFAPTDATAVAAALARCVTDLEDSAR